MHDRKRDPVEESGGHPYPPKAIAPPVDVIEATVPRILQIIIGSDRSRSTQDESYDRGVPVLF